MPRKFHIWSPEEIALLGTMNDADLAKQMGLARATVSQHRTRRGIPAHHDHHQRFDRAVAFAMLDAGNSPTDVAKQLGVSRRAIEKLRYE